ncbi:MAG: hypothetical protein R2704_11900 [Microthrixaceae bacterium]
MRLAAVGHLERFGGLKVVYAESQIGLMPYLLERTDIVWEDGVGGIELPNAPSSYVPGRVYGCIFDDQHGLNSRESVGMGSILLETDYPHAGLGTFPHSREVAHRLCSNAGMDADDTYAFCVVRYRGVRTRTLRHRPVAHQVGSVPSVNRRSLFTKNANNMRQPPPNPNSHG